IVVAKGGNGGWGNLQFKTSTNQAPRRANAGQPAVERSLVLRMKLIADVGLVGLPNAGKSTFLDSVTNANPKIADYPFTTLHPNLGVVTIPGTQFVIADVPGLIEGASEGRGIGDRFLGHIERCGVLVHIVDGSSESIGQDFLTIIQELEAYGAGLLDKPRLTILNKSDALSEDDLDFAIGALKGASQGEIMVMSGGLEQGTDAVLEKLGEMVEDVRAKEREEAGVEEWRP
ncbi:MAG: Obg family GTPase, partial [Planktomarina sp.]